MLVLLFDMALQTATGEKLVKAETNNAVDRMDVLFSSRKKVWGMELMLEASVNRDTIDKALASAKALCKDPRSK